MKKRRVSAAGKKREQFKGHAMIRGLSALIHEFMGKNIALRIYVVRWRECLFYCMILNNQNSIIASMNLSLVSRKSLRAVKTSFQELR